MDPLSLLVPLATAVGLVLALLTIREKLWPKAPAPHPLEAAVRDVAAAVRELKA
jgi:hypothetical protein